MNRFTLIIAFLITAFFPSAAIAAESGESVVVVYNERMSESRALAEYYAQRRQVPTNQIVGLSLPTTETMTREEYRDQLEWPLWRALEQRGLFTLGPLPKSPTSDKPAESARRVVAAKIRYATLCYGVPARILRDESLTEAGTEKLRPEVRRNEAAVDSELMLLPLVEARYPLTGPFRNVFYGATNAIQIQPTNGLLMVARLDGPSVTIARGLVDKAIEAETNGLWGRAYFDARGLTNGDYQMGDDWIRGAAQTTRQFGLETVLDDQPATFSAAFPMSQIALYAGWYDAGVSGPFTRPKVEFMPGAFAYHLHSYSAATIRTATGNWVGPLLAKGATATMGCVDEPYLSGTPDLAVFFSRFLMLGFSFGEAACASQAALSWQVTAIGDPLYRPFATRPQDLHAALEARHSKLIEWSHLRIVDLNDHKGVPLDKSIDYLERLPVTRTSAVLLEKLGELHLRAGQPGAAAEAWTHALAQDPSPLQRIRLEFTLADHFSATGNAAGAFEVYQKFLRDNPDYPDLPAIYEKIIPLAEKLGKANDATLYRHQLERLRPAK